MIRATILKFVNSLEEPLAALTAECILCQEVIAIRDYTFIRNTTGSIRPWRIHDL